MRRGLLTLTLLFAIALVLRGFLLGYLDGRARSHRIEQILQQAQERSAADDNIRADLKEVLNRKLDSFSEFQQQCIDLQSVLARSDEMEAQKRQMLADLKTQFEGDRKVQPVFETLRHLEDVSDKSEQVWREMIACSHRIESAFNGERERYTEICVSPAQKQLESLEPEVSKLSINLMNEVKDTGSIPPDLLRALAH